MRFFGRCLLLLKDCEKCFELAALLTGAINFGMGPILCRLDMPRQRLPFGLGGVLEGLQAPVGRLSRGLCACSLLQRDVTLLSQLGNLDFKLADQPAELGRLCGSHALRLGGDLDFVA